jgi:hypothetical protein
MEGAMSYTKLLITVSILVCIAIGFSFFQKSKNGTRMTQCNGTTDVAKLQCWEDIIQESLKKEGIEQAFERIAYLHNQDAAFARSCHEMVHILGQSAYNQFKSTGNVVLPEQTAFCAFGFYHGFMEMLIARKGTIAEAQAFCRYVDETLGTMTPGAKYGCYHGIGHGSTDIHNPVYFGNERAVIAPALANCEAFAADDHQLKLCATGVFDSIALAYYNNGENGFIMNKDDPLWLCREQPEKYKESCYLDMMPAMIWMGEYDLPTAGDLLLAHAEKEYIGVSMRSLAENSVRFVLGKKPVVNYISYCRTLDAPYSDICISGLGTGVMQFGTPGSEYADALAFCREDALTVSEKDICIKDVLQYVKSRYSSKKVADICVDIESEFQQYCHE